MNRSREDIYYAFNGKLIGTQQLRRAVCDVLQKMPNQIISYVTENCWFMGSMDDAYAFTFTGNDLKDQHLIFLSDDLMMQNEEQIQYSIAHEIGHVMLKHRNSTLMKQTKSEIAKQEEEADQFAIQYVPIP